MIKFIILLAIVLKTSSATCGAIWQSHIHTCENLTSVDVNRIKFSFRFGVQKGLHIRNSNISLLLFSLFPIHYKELKILNSTLPKLDENSFTRLWNLENITLQETNLSSLNGTILGHLFNLELLDLNHNKLSKLSNSTFEDVSLLRFLYLQNNKLSMIEDGVFKPLNKLEIIDLNQNQLKSVSNTLFSLKSLRILDLSSNNLTKIPIVGENIEKLYLGTNKIKSLENLSKLSKLTDLDLSYNELQTVDGEMFTLDSLETLNLRANNISNFLLNRNLKKLNLSENNIESLENITVSINLTHLDLSKNLIRKYESIGKLPLLLDLNMSFNNIEVLDKNVFNNLVNLMNLSISHNIIRTIEFGTFKFLTHLDISHNYLEKISYGMLPKMDYVNLSFNKIKRFKVTARIMELEGNLLRCRDLKDYKENIKGNSFNTENINGVGCSDDEDDEDTILDKVSKSLDEKLKGKTLSIFFKSDRSIKRTNLVKKIDIVGEPSCTISNINLIFNVIILLVLCAIVVSIYFKMSKKNLDDSLEFEVRVYE